MTTSSIAGTSQLATTLAALGTTALCETRNDLLKQAIIAAANSGGGGGAAAWGSITGTLSNQTDLQSALDLKAPLVSPTFTGPLTVENPSGLSPGVVSLGTTGGGHTVLRPSSVSVLDVFVDLPESGTLISTTSAGAVTNTMLAGSIDLTTKVTGILPSTNGGTGVNNAGTLTNASNTTITGGGTIALGGYTLTVPATGTAALLGTANTFTGAQTINNLTTITPPSASESTLTVKDFTTGNKSVQIGTYQFGGGTYGIITFGNLTPNGNNGTLWSNGSTITQLNTAAGGTIYLTAGGGTTLMTIEGSATGKYFFNSTGGFGFTDALFYRAGAAAMQLGANAAGVVTPQTFKACDRITSDGVGADMIIAGGRNRGASNGGSIIFQTSPQASAGVTGTLTTRLTIAANGDITPIGRMMLPMGEISYFNTTGTSVTISSTSDGSTNMVVIAPTTALTSGAMEFDNGGGNTGRLRYTGTTTRMFHIAITLSGTPQTSNDVFVFGCAKNGTVAATSKVLGSTSGTQFSAIHVSLELATNDYIELYIGNTTASRNFTCKSLNIFAMGH